MAKQGDIAYPWTKEDRRLACEEASRKLSDYFGLDITITPDNAHRSLHNIQRHQKLLKASGEVPLKFSVALCALHGACMGPIKGT